MSVATAREARTRVGLSEAEARRRAARGLANRLPDRTGRTYVEIARENLFTFVNGVIVVLAATLAALGEWSDALASVLVVGVNTVVGLVQEARAKRTLDRIALLTRPTATVVRDGVAREVDAGAVVLGDALRIAREGQVVVDGVLVDGGPVDLDESLLTGESEPVTKRVGDPLLSGSLCVGGEGVYEARAVGRDCFAYRVTEGARAFRRTRTPLQRQLDTIVRVVLVVAGAYLVALAAIAMVERLALVDALQAALVVAGLVPNGLFVVVAAAYALGAVRIAGRGILVQQANAVEALSHVDVLCLDKTGTLTTGRLSVGEVVPFGVTRADAVRALGLAVASARARTRTSDAIAAALPAAPRPVADEIPFSAVRKWSAVALPEATYVLGAPEALGGRLTNARAAVERAVAERTARGARVLVLATAAARAPLRDGRGVPRLPPLDPLCLVVLAEELRPDARETLARFAAAGVRLVIVSGDAPATAASVAASAGVAPSEVLAGAEIDALDDAALAAAAEGGALFGRATPKQKERLVAALSARGHAVGMIGDGVNDVLALKRSELAIAPRGGSATARAVADLVLLDDRFGALPAALREGQRIRNGMSDILRIFLARVFAVAFVIPPLAIVRAGFPLTAAENALVTLLTVGLPALVLAAWARPGPVSRENDVRSLLRFVVPTASSLAAVAFAVYVAADALAGDVVARHATTTTYVLCGLLLVLFAGRVRDPRRLALVAALTVAFAIVLAVPDLGAFFDVAPLAPLADLALVAVALAWAAAAAFAARASLGIRVSPDIGRPPRE